MPNFSQRIQLVLPPWWGTKHPTLDSVINGYAAGHSAIQIQINNLRPLMRLNTVTGDLLDIAGFDFFGYNLPRNINETDTVFRARIKAELFKVRGTRQSFIAELASFINAAPTVIDPRVPADTGVLGNIGASKVPTLFYNSVSYDCYTNLKMGFQWFVRLPNVGTYDNIAVLAKIASIMPAGTTAWTRL